MSNGITEFFLPMIIPTVTAQEHKIAVRGNKPVVYDTQSIKQAKQKFLSALSRLYHGLGSKSEPRTR